MKRREFITLIGGAAAMVRPLAAHAQQTDRMRRIGVLMHTTSDEPEMQARLAVFLRSLQEAGWSIGQTLRIESRWTGSDRTRLLKDAAELIGLNPDVILAGVGPTVEALQQVSRTVPIVFAQQVDPVGAGTIASLARPGGNATGFLQIEYGLSGKWPELLKEIAPKVTRIGVLREAGAAGIGQWAVMQTMAPPGMDLSPIQLGDAGDIERDITQFARESNGGLIAALSTRSQIHRALIVELAAQHRLPVVYPYRFFVAHGGLMSYGPDLLGQYRRAAGYVDRILKGEKPADLPVQAPTKYELAINLKTAKALGLAVPPTLLARANEVIE